MSSSHPRACLVVSHYNAWEPDQLLALLDQTKEIPAGLPFRTRVVVNQAVDKTLALPPRHSDVEVSYRPNTGYNIGAWDHGWRVGESFPFYLFLQEECIILKEDWMKSFVDAVSDTRVGLVGESMTPPETWSSWENRSGPLCRFFGLTSPFVFYNELVPRFLELAQERGADPGPNTSHLQSLIIGTRREVLDRIDGFPSWPIDYVSAVCSELMISKSVSSTGWDVRQIGWLPFSIISHPQWKRHPLSAALHKVTWRLPMDLQMAKLLLLHLWNQPKVNHQRVASSLMRRKPMHSRYKHTVRAQGSLQSSNEG